MSTLKVDTILKRTGTGTITVGQSGDTISIPSGATLSNQGTTVPTAFGKIGQVVTVHTENFNFDTTSTSYVDTGTSCSITPTATTSKIFVNFSGCAGGQRDGAENDNNFMLSRDGGSTYLTEKRIENYDYGSSGTILRGSFIIQFLDTPSTTSAITYKLFAKKNNSTKAIVGTSANSDINWTLLEVLA
jgi:hypothetical protein